MIPLGNDIEELSSVNTQLYNIVTDNQTMHIMKMIRFHLEHSSSIKCLYLVKSIVNNMPMGRDTVKLKPVISIKTLVTYNTRYRIYSNKRPPRMSAHPKGRKG